MVWKDMDHRVSSMFRQKNGLVGQRSLSGIEVQRLFANSICGEAGQSVGQSYSQKAEGPTSFPAFERRQC
jgi:hypothetical protein